LYSEIRPSSGNLRNISFSDRVAALAETARTRPSAVLEPLRRPEAPAAVPRDIDAIREARMRQVRLELGANDGSFRTGAKVAIKSKTSQFEAHAFYWAVVPIEKPEDARLFAAANDPEGARLRDSLIRDVALPGIGTSVQVAFVPIHWVEAEQLKKRFPELILVKDGAVYRGASPRSLFIGGRPEDIPRLVDGLERYGLKLHLSKESYRVFEGLGGSREINFNDARMATVMTHVIESLKPKLSPYLEIQPEAYAAGVRIGRGANATEVGAIFRTLSEGDVVPAFAMYSPTQLSLPHVKGMRSQISARTHKGDVLAASAIEYARERNPGLTKEDALIKMFVDPVLDVYFSLTAECFGMELHPQNFLFRFDENTGLVSKVVVRDLHGMGCDRALRQQRGLPDVFDPNRMKDAFPDLEAKDIDGWFMRNGTERGRYVSPHMFRTTFDFYCSMFFFHTLSRLHETGYLGKPEVDRLVERIKDRVEHYARTHHFDLRILPQPWGAGGDFWLANEKGKGILGQVLFRRRV
jgi:hypothetical protein